MFARRTVVASALALALLVAGCSARASGPNSGSDDRQPSSQGATSFTASGTVNGLNVALSFPARFEAGTRTTARVDVVNSGAKLVMLHPLRLVILDSAGKRVELGGWQRVVRVSQSIAPGDTITEHLDFTVPPVGTYKMSLDGSVGTGDRPVTIEFESISGATFGG